MISYAGHEKYLFVSVRILFIDLVYNLFLVNFSCETDFSDIFVLDFHIIRVVLINWKAYWLRG